MRWLPVLLVLCIAGAIVGMQWLGGGDPPAPTAAEEPPALPPTDAATPVRSGPWLEESVPAEPTSGDTEAESDEPERVAVDDAATATDGRIALVVHGSPPVPVADAEVLFVDEREAQRRLRGLPPPPRSEWPDRWGQRVRTDNDGTARVPGPRGALLVAARSGDEFAFAEVRSGRRGVTLTLVADEQLEVHVRRADDRPAVAAPLALLQWQGKGEAEDLWRGETAADGTLLLRHFQLYRRDPKQPVADERFAIMALLPIANACAVEFAGRPAPHAPVLLQLPPLGTLEVQLTDQRGTPLLSPAWIAVRPDGKPDATAPFPFAGGLLGRNADKPPGAEPVRLPYVTAGANLRVSAHFQGDRKGTIAVTAGPAKDDGLVRVVLPLDQRQVVLAGRCLRSDGTPHAPAMLSATVWHGDRDLVTLNLPTLADGRFDLVLTGRSEPPPFVLWVRDQVDTGADGAALELGARVHVPELTGGQRVELGDLVLGELPPLVSGLVVDDLGAPIAGADVRVQSHVPDRRREPWHQVPNLQTRTTDDGTFALFGELPLGELRVHADTDRHFAADQPLQVQGQQVHIRLDRNGIVRGRALLPDWIADGTASLTLRPVDETLRKDQTRAVDLRRRGGGRFTVEPLRPGRYDALVAVRNVREPLLVAGDCFVPPGESREPRLQQLDLRELLFRYRLRAVDAAGQPLAFDGPIQAHLSLPDGSPVEAGFRWQQGRAELITPSSMAELLFFGRGFAPQRLTLLPGDHDVFLQALRPALLELPGARALCGPTRKVRVSVILTDATGYPESLGGVDQRTGEQFSFPRWDLGRSSGAWLEQYDVVEVPLMKNGSYEVVLRVHATDSTRSPQASVSLGTFELRADAPSMLPVRVPVDAAALQQALTSVDERQRASEAEAVRR